ncbi:hypothetical protein [Gayadomonas joobiniege]|uniref:hypothetical protein n=1 Tax=Gayadomonas joobiniege TaxID=1234606 RepID=UPI00036228E3|nr:hypothetical protein [Gayadomonas joobiniege]
MEILLFGFVALVFKIIEVICVRKKFSPIKSFVISFITVLAAFLIVLPVGISIREPENTNTQTRLFISLGGIIVVSAAAGIKCCFNAHINHHY